MSAPVRILFVDDEERILRSLALQFRRHYEVLTESDPLRALQRLREEDIHVLVSDQRMPQMSGAQLLAEAREIAPNTLRILLTGYSDLDAAVEALNNGGIFRYLPKPIRRGLFEKGLKAAAEQALIWRAQPQQVVTRLAEVPRDEREQEKVGSLMGMLGRLRERLIA